MSFKLKGHFYLNYKKHPTKNLFFIYTHIESLKQINRVKIMAVISNFQYVHF